MRRFCLNLIISLFGLVRNYTNTLLVYLWVQTMPATVLQTSYERDFMLSLSKENHANTIKAFNQRLDIYMNYLIWMRF